jgi:holliday junction DNA helicase RuvA
VIASLNGTVLVKGLNWLVLDVAGVGFSVMVPNSLAARVSIGEKTRVFTSLIVREDAFVLFGFEDAEQISLFDHLRSVSGVGPKTALAAISTLSPAEIANAVANDDASAFQRVVGIGVKTAKLIVVSLSGKLSAMETNSTDSGDLLAAMQSLGWAERVAEPAVRQVLKTRADKPFGDLIRECLAILGAKQ